MSTCPHCEKEIDLTWAKANSDTYNNINHAACPECRMGITIVPIRSFELRKMPPGRLTHREDDWGNRYHDDMMVPSPKPLYYMGVPYVPENDR